MPTTYNTSSVLACVACQRFANTLDDLGETLARFDGVCLPGGPDVDPHRYAPGDLPGPRGAQRRARWHPCAAHDDHRYVHHPVRLAPGSRAAIAIGHQHPVGHSVHHQAIDRLGDGLVASGWAADGTIEAVELPGAWVLGVQWHPEDTAEHDADQQRLFAAFVAACRSTVARGTRSDA